MAKNYAPKQRHKNGHLVQLANLELYYEEYGQGKPLLLLHGFGGCTQNWQPFVAEFAKHFRLLLVDLRGHGYSTNPSNTFTHAQAAEDVFELLESIGVSEFSAMGMSTGGMVLLHMATKQVSRINSIVLISATSHFPNEARAIMQRVSYATMPTEVKEMYTECAKHGEEQIRQLISQFNALSQDCSDMNFTPQSLSTIQARTLLVHGERDAFFSTEIAKNLHDSIPQSSLWLIPNGEHVPIYNSAVPFSSMALDFLLEAE
ncbi:MAG: alpha/beta hydrolase [Bacteroidetes bacterium B1(2017)]|nr:MAG: alpha/beta hydrolase [Bacteroidetes bacterium B1(2017)]